VLTRAQTKRKAANRPLYIAPPARRRKHVGVRRTIDDLPDELLLLIIEVLDATPKIQGNLYAACLVSRRFNRLAVSYLYEYFQVNEPDTFSHADFLSTLLEVPALGSHVRRLAHTFKARLVPPVNTTNVAAKTRESNPLNAEHWI
jgi:hypothetical protein